MNDNNLNNPGVAPSGVQDSSSNILPNPQPTTSSPPPPPKRNKRLIFIVIGIIVIIAAGLIFCLNVLFKDKDSDDGSKQSNSSSGQNQVVYLSPNEGKESDKLVLLNLYDAETIFSSKAVAITFKNLNVKDLLDNSLSRTDLLADFLSSTLQKNHLYMEITGSQGSGNPVLHIYDQHSKTPYPDYRTTISGMSSGSSCDSDGLYVLIDENEIAAVYQHKDSASHTYVRLKISGTENRCLDVTVTNSQSKEEAIDRMNWYNEVFKEVKVYNGKDANDFIKSEDFKKYHSVEDYVAEKFAGYNLFIDVPKHFITTNEQADTAGKVVGYRIATFGGNAIRIEAYTNSALNMAVKERLYFYFNLPEKSYKCDGLKEETFNFRDKTYVVCLDEDGVDKAYIKDSDLLITLATKSYYKTAQELKQVLEIMF